MTESSIKRLKRKHFIETCITMLDWWVEEFPDALVAKEQRVKLTGVVKGNDEREIACLKDWHSNMQTPLHGSVKYAAAVKRILGEDGTIYHACEYKDLRAAMASADGFDTLHSLQPEERVEEKPGCKVQMWELIHQLNQYSLSYFDASLTVPTRDEIQANIRIHKASKAPSKPAMTRGFESAYESLVSHLRGDAEASPEAKAGDAAGKTEGVADDSSLVDVSLDTRADTQSDTQSGTQPGTQSGSHGTKDSNDSQKDGLGEAAKSWADAIKDHNLVQVCADRDVSALQAVPFSHPQTRSLFRDSHPHKFDDVAWKLIGELNSVSTVQGGIPPNMMNRIESTAHRIAGEIACGKTDLGNLNLAQLGQSVLEGCDTSEIQQLASGMGSILPMLQSLQGVHGIPSGK